MTDAVQRASSRQRAIQLSQRVAALEAENAELRRQLGEWAMHHAHAALGIQKAREAAATGDVDAATLLAIVDDADVTGGADRYVAGIVDGLVKEWTRNPIPEVSRSAVRDWLLAQRSRL